MECLLLSELAQVKVRVNLLRIIDENGILRNYVAGHSLHQVSFTLQLHSHGRPHGAPHSSSPFTPKHLFQETVIFHHFYPDLSPDAKISIQIWSSAKAHQPGRPLGATVMPLFDERGELRQGKFHLFIWPDTGADLEDPSSTPGQANDDNIEMLNFISDRLEECNRSGDPSSFRAEETLKFRLSYIYRLIPAAFLEVEFPKFALPVFFCDKLSPEYEDGGQESQEAVAEFEQCLEVNDPDADNGLPNPLEENYYTLRSEKETSSEKLVPTREEVRLLERAAVKKFRLEVRPADREQFFKFRYYLAGDRKYLIYLVNSLPPQYAEEGELGALLRRWEPPEPSDMLHLLSREFSLNPAYNKRRLAPSVVRVIRNYAVELLAQLKDHELTYMLLFLVQALKYDCAEAPSQLIRLLVARSQSSPQVAALVFWYLRAESEPLAAKEAKTIKEVKETERNIRLYQKFLEQLEQELAAAAPDTLAQLRKQTELFGILKKVAKQVKAAPNAGRKAEVRKRLAEVDWDAVGGVSYPLDVGVVLQRPVVEECTVFTSKMAPMKLTFETAGEGRFSFMFKSGDDLRQDQMILEMFDLMDRLLKGVNQDYRLSPYKALACSRSDGYVEFVANTRTFQETDLKNYLGQLVREQSGEVMQNYVFSCAGYCAITYFFGIGDRHLENLLISSTGKMLHIDFGFILGRDPKPYPPPIKIRKDMIEAMGGLEHENFKTFKSKCLEAYMYLRKHGKMVYNLVYLMLDSGLKDVHAEGIAKLYDKFNVAMNDTEAEKHFLLVLEECKNAIAAVIADGIHRWAMHFK